MGHNWKGQDWERQISASFAGFEEAAAEEAVSPELPYLWGNKSWVKEKSEWPQLTQQHRGKLFQVWQRKATHRPEVVQDEDNAPQGWPACYSTAISSMEGLCGLAPLAPGTSFVDEKFPMNRLGCGAVIVLGWEWLECVTFIMYFIYIRASEELIPEHYWGVKKKAQGDS